MPNARPGPRRTTQRDGRARSAGGRAPCPMIRARIDRTARHTPRSHARTHARTHTRTHARTHARRRRRHARTHARTRAATSSRFSDHLPCPWDRHPSVRPRRGCEIRESDRGNEPADAEAFDCLLTPAVPQDVRWSDSVVLPPYGYASPPRMHAQSTHTRYSSQQCRARLKPKVTQSG